MENSNIYSEKEIFRNLGKICENKMIWNMTNLCNYRCVYCGLTDSFLSKQHKDVAKYSISHIEKSFNDSGKKWLIYLNGGEPFLYPNIVELCKALTKNHYLGINTNLSSDKIIDFANAIDPEKVVLINAAIHIYEVEKHKNGFEKYINNFNYLQEKGFNIVLSYVTYPPLFKRLREDFALFRKKGMKNIGTKTFKGIYNNKLYPEFYTEEEKKTIKEFSYYSVVNEIADGRISYYKKLCEAGKSFVVMDLSGNLKRCGASSKKYGNFFTGKYKLENKPKPCPLKECTCAYQGEAFVVEGKSSYLSFLSELCQEKYFSNIRKILSVIKS